MKTRTKALLMLLCAVLLVAGSVLGTLAYLTSTDAVKNTFTVGNVKITLDEAKVGTDGKALTGDDAARVKENNYKLMPGHTYDKDPTVTVKAGSESSYVRLLVTVTFEKELTEAQLATKLDGIFTGYNANWTRIDDPDLDCPKSETKENTDGSKYTVITYEYRYKDVVPAANMDQKLPALFTNVKVPGDWTNEDLAGIGGFTINIVGQAIQADGFTNADAAWAAFN